MRARVKISPREKGKTRDVAGSFLTRLAFLAWDDFHARARFARSTFPDRTNGFIFLTRKCMTVLPVLKKSGRNNEVRVLPRWP